MIESICNKYNTDPSLLSLLSALPVCLCLVRKNLEQPVLTSVTLPELSPSSTGWQILMRILRHHWKKSVSAFSYPKALFCGMLYTLQFTLYITSQKKIRKHTVHSVLQHQPIIHMYRTGVLKHFSMDRLSPNVFMNCLNIILIIKMCSIIFWLFWPKLFTNNTLCPSLHYL